MSDIRFNRWLHQSGTGGVYQDSTGRVGIGTSVPTSTLDIVGTVNATTLNVTAGGSSSLTTLNVSGVSTFSGRASFIGAGSSVGINTNNPTKTLDVRGETTFGVGITPSDLNWNKDTYQQVYSFSGITGGSSSIPADGVVSLVNPNANPSNTRIGAIVFGNKVSGITVTGNAGIKAIIESYTNTNVANAADTGANIRFQTKPDNGDLTVRMTIDSAGRVTTPNQPSANWQISCNTSTFVRTLSLKRDANNNVSSVAAGNGSSHGSVGRFTAPIAGVYLITIRGTGTTISGSNELLSAYGSWSTGVNVLNPTNEVLDLRTTPLINDGIGWSCTLYLSANDYWELDWYRPASTVYVGTTFWDISTVLLG